MTKLCECGCGNPAPLAKSDYPSKGHVKGEPVRFISGHNTRGRKLSREARFSISNKMMGNQNGRGPRGTSTSQDVQTIHEYVARHFPKQGRCERCGREGKTDYAFLLHPQTHTRNRDDYEEMCRSCHMNYDYSIGQRKKAS